MAHQRGHRAPGDLEVGATDVFMRHPTPHIAPRDDRPEFLVNWERRRPKWLMEMIAEWFGVALYCWGGMGASAAFFTTSAAKEVGFGSLMGVGWSYMFAIALAIILCGPTSGAHLNPCFTIAFATFKGFPWRKVPQYIFAQILGGMTAGLVVYAQYKQPLDAITAELKAAGLEAQIFTPTGPAFPIALFKGPQQAIGWVFLNEFVGALVIAVAVFSVLDQSNIFVTPASAPFLIGAIYFVTITDYAPQSVALNTARDLGGRLAAACIWGKGAFPADYTALAVLTNILASLVGAAFQVFFLSDGARPKVHAPPSEAPGSPAPINEKNGHGEFPMTKNSTEHYDN